MQIIAILTAVSILQDADLFQVHTSTNDPSTSTRPSSTSTDSLYLQVWVTSITTLLQIVRQMMSADLMLNFFSIILNC